MKFLNRDDALIRLDRLMDQDDGTLGVVWGRRRVGKSRLLLEWSNRRKGLYTLADQSAPAIQRAYLAHTLATVFPGFDGPVYPDWKTLLCEISQRAKVIKWRGPLIMDEFPYLVAAEPALASIMQGWIDNEARRAGLVVVIAGSSQRMMQGIVLDGSAPLYGRARESFMLRPLEAGWITQALGLSNARQAVEAYSVWGGIPRYWELAQAYGCELDRAVDELVLDPDGVLHDEPDRLLMEETPSALSVRPVLDAIGMGAHRLSEIAGRMGAPATSLSHSLSRLQQLGVVAREQPWGVTGKSSKKTLYKISDPFFRFWFRAVAPHKGELSQGSAASRRLLWKKLKARLVQETWEDLCRQSIPRLQSSILECDDGWLPAGRYWSGNEPEWDVVSSSLNGGLCLLGEAKWGDRPVSSAECKGMFAALRTRPLPPPVRGKEARHALFVAEAASGGRALTAEDVLKVLKQ